MDSTRNSQKFESFRVARFCVFSGFLKLGGFFVVFCRFFVEKNTNNYPSFRVSFQPLSSKKGVFCINYPIFTKTFYFSKIQK